MNTLLSRIADESWTTESQIDDSVPHEEELPAQSDPGVDDGFKFMDSSDDEEGQDDAPLTKGKQTGRKYQGDCSRLKLILPPQLHHFVNISIHRCSNKRYNG